MLYDVITILNLVGVNQESDKNEAAFVTSMQGLVGFTRQAANELSPYNIQVYMVETGENVVEKVLALRWRLTNDMILLLIKNLFQIFRISFKFCVFFFTIGELISCR